MHLCDVLVVLCELNPQEIRLNQEQLKLWLPHGTMIQYDTIFTIAVTFLVAAEYLVLI